MQIKPEVLEQLLCFPSPPPPQQLLCFSISPLPPPPFSKVSVCIVCGKLLLSFRTFFHKWVPWSKYKMQHSLPFHSPRRWLRLWTGWSDPIERSASELLPIIRMPVIHKQAGKRKKRTNPLYWTHGCPIKANVKHSRQLRVQTFQFIRKDFSPKGYVDLSKLSCSEREGNAVYSDAKRFWHLGRRRRSLWSAFITGPP